MGTRLGTLLSTSLLGWLFAAVTAVPAPAQETREHDFPALEKEQPRMGDHVKLRTKFSSRYVGESDFGSFDVSSHQPEARVSLSFPVAPNVGLRLMTTGRMLLMDFGGSTDLFGLGPERGEPFEDLSDWTTRLQAAYLLDEDLTLFSPDERWALLAEGKVESSWEEGSSFDEGFEGGGALAVGYQLGDRLEIALGVAVGSDAFEGGISFSPVVELDWKIDDDWTLRSYGTGFQLERRIWDGLRVFTRARFESASFRLDDRGPGVGRGELRVRQLPIGLGVRWDINSWLRVRLVGGAILLHELRVRSEQEQTLSRKRGDVSPYVTLRFDLPH